MDTELNGLRNTILPMSATDPALLNAILAVPAQCTNLIKVASYHLQAWKKRPDPRAKGFIEEAMVNLRNSLSDPATAKSEATIATTYILAMHEVRPLSSSNIN